MPDQRLTVAAYARHRGCSRKAVYAALNDGRITRGDDGLIDAAAADRAWSRNTRTRVGGPGAGGAGGDDGEASYTAARARKELALAELRELELAQRRGELVPVAEVARHFRTQTSAAKDRLRMVAHRVAGRLAVETDEHEVRLILEDEIDRALGDVADAARRYADAVDAAAAAAAPSEAPAAGADDTPVTGAAA